MTHLKAQIKAHLKNEFGYNLPHTVKISHNGHNVLYMKEFSVCVLPVFWIAHCIVF